MIFSDIVQSGLERFRAVSYLDHPLVAYGSFLK